MEGEQETKRARPHLQVALYAGAFVLCTALVVVILSVIAPRRQGSDVLPPMPAPTGPAAKAEPSRSDPVKPVVSPPQEPPKPVTPPQEPPKPPVTPPDRPAVEPPPQAPKLDPAERYKRSLDSAAKLIQEARPVLDEIADAIEPLPTDADILKPMLKKAETVEQRLLGAQVLYLMAKKEAPEETSLDRRFWQLDKLLETVKRCITWIKARLG
jgi:hypothetical protein